MNEYLTPNRIISMISAEENGIALQEASINGDKKKVKKLLKAGVKCDVTNNEGQTPLWWACVGGHSGVVDLLLQYNANPNERCRDGSTPVHAACQRCDPKILSKLIESGGDLRLHDEKGQTIKDWIMSQNDNKKRLKMFNFIEQTRIVAMTESGRDLLLEKQQSVYNTALRSKESTTASFVNLFKTKSNNKSLTLSPSVHSNGYGKIYCGDGEHLGTMATIPLVNETSIRHDECGCTFNNGPFMVMESMLWEKVPVTVKRLHRDPKEGGNVDLLIKENEYMARLRHPNILLMMAVCQTNNLDNLLLLYERVGCGSLYSYLYQKVETLDTLTMCEILRQIAEAVLYLHQENLFHCSITSHAVHLVLPNFAKLGNFEYMVDSASTDSYVPGNKVIDNKHLNAVYNWLAPELLEEKQPTKKSDLYGLCAVLWEILHGTPPWCGMSAPQIFAEVVDNRNMLDIKESIKNPFSVLLQYGLAIGTNRKLSVEEFRDILGNVLLDYHKMGITGDSPHPHRLSKANQPSKKSHDQDSGSTADEETLKLKKRPKKRLPSSSSKLSTPTSKLHDMHSVSISDSSEPEKVEHNRKNVKHLGPFHRTIGTGTSPHLLSKFPDSQSLDQIDNTKEHQDNNNNSAAGKGSETTEENTQENTAVFLRDRAKSEFFGVSPWSQPNSTSTPTSSSPALNVDTRHINARLVETSAPNTSVTKHETTQVTSYPLSPQNPFKMEYHNYKPEEVQAPISSIITRPSQTMTKQHDQYAVPATISFSSFSSSLKNKATTVSTSKKEDVTTTTQVTSCPLSPQNPFKSEYKKYEGIKVTFSSTSPSMTTQHGHYTVPTASSFSATFAPATKNSSTTGYLMKKSASTVYGALLGDHVSKTDRPNAMLKDNYFIAQDSQEVVEEDILTTQKSGPVYLTAKRSSMVRTLPPSSRISFAETKPSTRDGQCQAVDEDILTTQKSGPVYLTAKRSSMIHTLPVGSRISFAETKPSTRDSQCRAVDEDILTTQKSGPVYLTAKRSSMIHTLPVGSRMSLAETKPSTHLGSVVSQVSWNKAGTRHSWAPVLDQHDNPKCFKPASHRSGFSTSPGRTGNPVPTGAMSHVNFSMPEMQPQHPTDHTTGHLKMRSYSVSAVPRQTRFSEDVVDNSGYGQSGISGRQYNSCHNVYEGQPTVNANVEEEPDPQRLSPRDSKDEWYEETGSIKNIISAFQDLGEKHAEKQAILVFNSKTKPDSKQGENYILPNQKQIHQEMQQHIKAQVQQQQQSLQQPLVTTDRVEKTISAVDETRNSIRPSQIVKKNVTVAKTVMVSPACLRTLGRAATVDVYPPTSSFTSEYEGVHLSTLPHKTQHDQKSCGISESEPETDPEIYEAIDTALETARTQIIKNFTHPECPHKADSLSRVKEVTKYNKNNNCADIGKYVYETVSGHQRNYLPSANCYSDKQCSHMQRKFETPSNDERDITMVSDIGSERREDDIEDIYFDDVFDNDLMKEKHMRLQSTLPLDSSLLSQSTVSVAGSNSTKRNTSYDQWLSISGCDIDGSISQRKARKDQKIRAKGDYDSSKMNGCADNILRGYSAMPGDGSRCQTITSIVMDDEELLV